MIIRKANPGSGEATPHTNTNGHSFHLADQLVATAVTISGCPIARIITIDREDFVNVSLHGLGFIERFSKDKTLNERVVEEKVPLYIPDTLKDPKASQSPYVAGSPHLRFFFGIPLLTAEGRPIAVLSVADTKPRTLTKKQRSSLEQLAKVAESVLLNQCQAIAIERSLEEATDILSDHHQLVKLNEAILSNTRYAIITTDPEGRITSSNQAASTLTGYSQEELATSQNMTALFRPKEYRQKADHLTEQFGSEVEPGFQVLVHKTVNHLPNEEDWTVVKKDGTHLPTHFSITANRDKCGHILGFVFIGEDITERHQFQSQLLESEERTRLFADYAPAAVAMFDRNMRYLVASQKWIEDYKLQGKRIIGQSHYDVFPEIPEDWKEIHRRCLAGETNLNDCDAFQRADGSVQWIHWRVQPWHDSTGDIGGLVMFTEDVTQDIETARNLEESQEKFRVLSEASPIGIYATDAKGQCTYVNKLWCKLAGLDEERAKADGWAEALHPDDRQRIYRAWKKIVRKGVEFDEEFRFLKPDMSVTWVTGKATAVMDREGNCQGYIGTCQDITERKRIQNEVANQRERLHVTLQSIGDAVITADLDGNIDYMNPVAEFMTGWCIDEAIGQPASEILRVIDEETREELINPIEQCLRIHNSVSIGHKAVLVNRVGVEYGIEDTASPIRDEYGRLLGCVLVFNDVTEQRKLAKQIKYQAVHDSLTGAFNRNEFESRLESTLKECKESKNRHALLYIDLDRFKLVNDSCGHAAGDKLLEKVTDIIKTSVRSTDTVARIGGDEFTAILYDCPFDRAKTIASNICDKINDFRFTYEDTHHRIGASIGLTQIDGTWEDAATLIKAADSACFAAKEGGRSRVHVYEPADEGRHQVQAGWASRIETALDEDQFVLFAQTIAPLSSTSDETCLEILVRMCDEEGTLIPPGAFISAAERFHLISKIDRWVFKNVLSELEKLHQNHQPLPTVFINLSGQSLGDPQVQTFLQNEIAEAPHLANSICLEITETIAVSNLEQAAAFIQKLRDHGVRFALDDFGSGVSSFHYLKNLPVDLLKIDGQFIQGLSKNPIDHLAVRHMVEYAQALGLKSIAEFVEDEATLQELKKMGLDYAQGYHIHRPEPFLGLLKTQPKTHQKAS